MLDTSKTKKVLEVSLLQNFGFNQLKRAKHGYILYNIHDRYIGRSIKLYGEFSEFEVTLFKQICKPGFIVVEVGANIGTHTLALSKMVTNLGKVYAFEPQRIVFQTLCANMALNSIENVEAFCVALSDSNGKLLIPKIDYNKPNNFGGIELDKFDSGDSVLKTTLDQFLDLKRLNFLKIDVEGMEIEVIKGASESIKKFKPIMYVENDRVEKSKKLIDLIINLEYEIYFHNPPLYNPNNFEKNSTNVFKNIVSKNLLCIHKSSHIQVKGLKKLINSNSL